MEAMPKLEEILVLTRRDPRIKAIKMLALSIGINPANRFNKNFLFLEACAVLLYYDRPEAKKFKLDMRTFLTEFSDSNSKPELELEKESTEELEILLKFRNFLAIATPRVIKPNGNLEHLLDLCTFMTEGKSRKYITGGGATIPTRRRVLIYRHN